MHKIKFIIALLFVSFSIITVAQDSTYILQAQKEQRSFIFKNDFKICLIYSTPNTLKRTKIKGKITNITDTSITIYKIHSNENTIIQIHNIIRFSRANHSLFRYIGIVAIGTVISTIIVGDGLSDNNWNNFAMIPLFGASFCGYSLLPAIYGEFYRKHYIRDGWRLTSKKYPSALVSTFIYRSQPINKLPSHLN
jgi:hypothetical protein